MWREARDVLARLGMELEVEWMSNLEQRDNDD